MVSCSMRQDRQCHVNICIYRICIYVYICIDISIYILTFEYIYVCGRIWRLPLFNFRGHIYLEMHWDVEDPSTTVRLMLCGTQDIQLYSMFVYVNMCI